MPQGPPVAASWQLSITQKAPNNMKQHRRVLPRRPGSHEGAPTARRGGRGRRAGGLHRAAVVLAALLASASLFVAAGSAPAWAASLTNVNWSLSDNQTGLASQTYSWSADAATTATLTAVTMTVPCGTGGTPAVGQVYGLPSGTLSDNFSTNTTCSSSSPDTLTYTLSLATAVSAGTGVFVSVTGITNTSSAQSYTSTLTTEGALGAVDTGTASASLVAVGSVNEQVVVPESTEITVTPPAQGLLVSPPDGFPQPSVLGTGISTNAASGATLAVGYSGGTGTASGYTLGPCATSGTAPATSAGQSVNGSGGCWGFVSSGSTDWASASSLSVQGGSPAWSTSAAANTLFGVAAQSAGGSVVASGASPFVANVNLAFDATSSYLLPADTYDLTLTETITPRY